MFILLAVFLFIFMSIAMLVLRLVRPRLSIQGFLVVLATLAGLVVVALARTDIPSSITLLNWSPQTLFPVSPTLVVDDISWYLSMGLVALAATAVITSIARLGRSIKVEPDTKPIVNPQHDDTNVQTPTSGKSSEESGEITMPDWLFWIAVLVITSLGLLAVTAGNLLTLLLSWAALDLVEAAVLIGHTLKSEGRERAMIVFSTKMGGTVILLITGLVAWSRGGSLNYDTLSPAVSILLVLAAAVRLGVLPPMIPYTHRLKIRPDLATVLYMVPATACAILLIRVAPYIITGGITSIITVLTVLVGLVSAIQWLTAQDEDGGRHYWLVAAASMAVLSALTRQQMACLAWSIAALLSGGLVFSFPIRHRNLLPVIILGAFNFSALPFSPTWQTAVLYQPSQELSAIRGLGFLFFLSFFVIQSTLLAGLIRHLLRGILPAVEEKSIHYERWVWVIFPIGLSIIVITHLLLGWFLLPDLTGLPAGAWIIGPLTLLLASLFIYLSFRFAGGESPIQRLANAKLWKRAFSNEWFYNLVWGFYRYSARLISLISTVLEGEGGILWALVLFALIFVFLQR